jgi:hypothetical protein
MKRLYSVIGGGWPCNIGTTLTDVQSLQALYAADFSGVCSPMTGIAELIGPHLKINSNPADAEFTLVHNGLNVRHLRLLTMEGRSVQEITDLEGDQIRVSTASLPNGLYMVQAVTDRGAASVKVMVQH